MKRYLGIDLGIYDSSVCTLMEIKEDGKLYIMKQKELTQEQQTKILAIYYSSPPKQKEKISCGYGLMVAREVDVDAHNRLVENYNCECIQYVCNLLGLDRVHTMTIDFNQGNKQYIMGEVDTDVDK